MARRAAGRPVLPPRSDPEVVTVDGIRHYLAAIRLVTGAEVDGPFTLIARCGLAMEVTGYAVSVRDRVSCSACLQRGPS